MWGAIQEPSATSFLKFGLPELNYAVQEIDMYPLIRFASAILREGRAPKLGLLDTHVSQHICWPWDIDPFMELNNGRTLTL